MKLKKMEIKNFKGIKNLEVSIGVETTILGANATGKSTIMDAFFWVITGKDSHDKADFEIKPLDKDNNPIHFLESSVYIETDSVNIKKIYKEKWTKKRGQEEQEFSGHETEYFINEVPLKKKDFEDKIKELIKNEEAFKVLSNPLYFSETLDWKKRREILFNFADIKTDKEIIQNNKKFEVFQNCENIEEEKAKIKYSKNKLIKEKESIPAIINELQNNIANENMDPLLEERKKLEIALENIEKELTIYTATEKEKELYEKLNTLRKQWFQENEKTIKAEEERIQKIKIEIQKQEKEKNNLEYEKSKIQFKAKDFEKTILKENLLAELRNDYIKTQKKELEITPNKKCPACSQLIPIELQKEEYENMKKHELFIINKKGTELKTEISEAKLNLEKAKLEIEKIDIEINKTLKTIKELEEKTQLKLFETNEKTETEKEIAAIEKELVSINKIDKTETKAHKERVKNLIHEIDIKISKIESEKGLKERIKILSEKEKELAAQITDLEKQEFLAEEFVKYKVSLIEKEINSKFKIVKFKLFNEQINGGIQEVCEVLLNGIPYKQVNTAGRIQAGIDIINTFKEFYNLDIPVFIDNRESITELPENNLQIINLIVNEKEKQLKIIKEE